MNQLIHKQINKYIDVVENIYIHKWIEKMNINIYMYVYIYIERERWVDRKINVGTVIGWLGIDSLIKIDINVERQKQKCMHTQIDVKIDTQINRQIYTKIHRRINRKIDR